MLHMVGLIVRTRVSTDSGKYIGLNHQSTSHKTSTRNQAGVADWYSYLEDTHNGGHTLTQNGQHTNTQP